ncbi:hypothetical protein [Jiulongibacter sp. NS-SX5]|uniref:hypothetical protein n=1 Tax=Jiulongibacter sp. NS-SX5 TaxID=3463854 RepID=UPI004059BC25
MERDNNKITRNYIPKTHLFGGILVVIIFVYTGQYMKHDYNGLQDVGPMNRALFRAGHLYILLFGLINAALGSHLKLSSNTYIKPIQLIGSAAIFLSTFSVIYAFFLELPSESIDRPLTKYSLFLVLFGVSVHGLISLVPQE